MPALLAARSEEEVTSSYIVTLTVSRKAPPATSTTAILLGNTPWPTAPPVAAPNKGLSAGATGAIVGGILTALLLGVLCYCCCWKRAKQSDEYRPKYSVKRYAQSPVSDEEESSVDVEVGSGGNVPLAPDWRGDEPDPERGGREQGPEPGPPPPGNWNGERSAPETIPEAPILGRGRGTPAPVIIPEAPILGRGRGAPAPVIIPEAPILGRGRGAPAPVIIPAAPISRRGGRQHGENEAGSRPGSDRNVGDIGSVASRGSALNRGRGRGSLGLEIGEGQSDVNNRGRGANIGVRRTTGSRRGSRTRGSAGQGFGGLSGNVLGGFEDGHLYDSPDEIVDSASGVDNGNESEDREAEGNEVEDIEASGNEGSGINADDAHGVNIVSPENNNDEENDENLGDRNEGSDAEEELDAIYQGDWARRAGYPPAVAHDGISQRGNEESDLSTTVSEGGTIDTRRYRRGGRRRQYRQPSAVAGAFLGYMLGVGPNTTGLLVQSGPNQRNPQLMLRRRPPGGRRRRESEHEVIIEQPAAAVPHPGEFEQASVYHGGSPPAANPLRPAYQRQDPYQYAAPYQPAARGMNQASGYRRGGLIPVVE